MTISIGGQWANAFSPSLSLPAIIAPALQSLPVTAGNTAGDWLFAICVWQQAEAGQGASVSVEDDAHNRWEPLGAPAADSSANGVTRVSIWYAPAARVGNSFLGVTTVMCAPTGPVSALGMLVVDVAGISPWDEISFVPVTAFANSGTSLGLTSPVPLGRAQAFALTAAVADSNTATLTLTGTGWTNLATTSIGSGSTAGELAFTAAWQAITTAQTVTWGSSVTADLAAIIGAVVVTPAAPVQPNPNWPVVVTEIAPGSGPGTPPSQLAWESVSARDLGVNITGLGQPYLLGGLQAAQGTLTLDNPDLALSPPGNGAYAGIDSGTPVRVRAIWTPSSTPHYVWFSGYLQQAPTSLDEQLRGVIQGTVTDAFAYTTSYLAPVLQEELLSEPSLYALWPCTDPTESLAASNKAPGNANPLLVTVSKYGTGAAQQQFAQNSGALLGDSGSGMWGQTGVVSAGLQGNSLYCADANFPHLSGGVTVEGWFQFTATTPGTGNVITLMNSVCNILQIEVNTATLGITGYQNPTNTTLVTVSTLTFDTAPLWHVAVAFNRSKYVIYINGAQVASGSWTYKLPPSFTQFWCNGNFASGAAAFFGKLYNGYTFYPAVFSSMLPAARVAAHYQAGAVAFAGEFAHQRIERLLGYGGNTGRRCIVPEAPGMPGAFSYAATTPPQDVTPMASLATIGGTVPSLYTPGKPGFSPASGTQVNQALTDTAASTVPAVFAVTRTGAFFFYPRSYTAAMPVKWVCGDNQPAAEIPIQPGAVFPYDPGRVYNNVQLTQPDSGTVTVPAVAEQGSVNQYGGQSYQATAYLLDDATSGYTYSPAMTDLANWIAATQYAPHMRAEFTVLASHITPLGLRGSPLAWPFVLGASPGDLVTVNARPPTSPGAVISVTGRIVQIAPTLTMGLEDSVAAIDVTLDIAPEQDWLTCDDVTDGLLSGQNPLGW